MKTLFIISLLITSTSIVVAKPDIKQESPILGRWKIVATKFVDKPLLPCWMDIVGEAEFTNDGIYSGWIQFQSDPSGKILLKTGRWSFENHKLKLELNGEEESFSANVEFRSDVMVLRFTNPEPYELHYKREKLHLNINQVEGLKFDYLISFPSKWSVITPTSINQVSEEQRPVLEKSKCRAYALSPNNEASVQLLVSSRVLNDEYLDIESNSNIQSLGITKVKIGDTEWRIQKTRFLNAPIYGFTASTYHNYKTVRLIFRFSEDYLEAKSTFDYVLSSFTISENEENMDLRYGKLIDHDCGKPVMYVCGDSTNSLNHYLYYGDTCPHCGKKWISYK